MEAEVLIECNVQQGLFAQEYGVEVTAEHQVISLYVDREYVSRKDNAYFLRAKRIDDEYAMLPGERLDTGNNLFRIPTQISNGSA